MVKNLLTERIKKLQASLLNNQALLLSKNSDIYYFSSFINTVPEERTAFCLVTKEKAYLLLQDFLARPKYFSGEILTGCSTHRLAEHLTKIKTELKIEQILLDFDYLSVNEFKAISKLGFSKIDLINKQVIWQLRTKKDQTELKKIKKALRITQKALTETIQELRIGLSEIEVKKILENKILAQADCDLAFPSIVAFNQNSTLPHHQAGKTKLRNNSIVLIDVGAKYQHYCSDMTRTVFFKTHKTDKTSPKEQLFNKVLKIVKNAYRQAEKLLNQQEIMVAELDLACRNYIKQQGYGDNFIHTTGHGLGIDIHEPPSIYKNTSSPLSPGMAITIEPGIYLKGKFGVRWENTVFTKNLPSN